jgi:hypothetical protein
MAKQEIKDIAMAEVMNPTFALTKQFLTVNKVVLQEKRPFVEDIILREDKSLAEVYFPIEGERYYFVIYINTEPQLSVRSMEMSSGNLVYFSVTSQEHSLDKLITLAGMEPTRKWKADKKTKHNGFEIKPSLKKTGNVEDKLHRLITLLQPYRENLYTLSTLAPMGINIAYWGYQEQMGGIDFDREMIQKLANLNLPIDIDLYAGGPDLEG